MPYPNEHAARLTDPDQYDSVRRENDALGKGVHALYGVKGDTSELQSIRFDKTKFTVSEARQWLREHEHEPIEFEPARNPDSSGPPPGGRGDGPGGGNEDGSGLQAMSAHLRILQEGEWKAVGGMLNPKKGDLPRAAEAFNRQKARGEATKLFRNHSERGHRVEAGDIKRLYMDGEWLCAEVDVYDEFEDEVKPGVAVSVEANPHDTIDGVEYPWTITDIAYLAEGDRPAVEGAEIVRIAAEQGRVVIVPASQAPDGGGSPYERGNRMELEEKVERLQAELDEAKGKAETLESEKEELQKSLDETKAEQLKAEFDRKWKVLTEGDEARIPAGARESLLAKLNEIDSLDIRLAVLSSYEELPTLTAQAEQLKASAAEDKPDGEPFDEAERTIRAAVEEHDLSWSDATERVMAEHPELFEDPKEE